jgi:hypothetical protein
MTVAVKNIDRERRLFAASPVVASIARSTGSAISKDGDPSKACRVNLRVVDQIGHKPALRVDGASHICFGAFHEVVIGRSPLELA